MMEEKHLADLHKQFPIFGIVAVALRDGSATEGFICGMKVDNDFHPEMRSPMRYAAEMTIRRIDGTLQVIDFLDVARMQGVTEARLRAYADAGVVTIVDPV